MDEPLLDSEKRHKYPSIWRTGLTGGVATLFVSLFIGFLVFEVYRDSLSFASKSLLVGLSVFLGVSVAMFRIAAWGKRDRLYLRIFATGFISYQILAMALLSLIFANDFFSNSNNMNWLVIKGALAGNILVVIFAFILWIIPGKLPYFRKQVER
ncbi:hypothetical protein BH09BAC1_BH09BAC1_11470 [soil metagenome]